MSERELRIDINADVTGSEDVRELNNAVRQAGEEVERFSRIASRPSQTLMDLRREIDQTVTEFDNLHAELRNGNPNSEQYQNALRSLNNILESTGLAAELTADEFLELWDDVGNHQNLAETMEVLARVNNELRESDLYTENLSSAQRELGQTSNTAANNVEEVANAARQEAAATERAANSSKDYTAALNKKLNSTIKNNKATLNLLTNYTKIVRPINNARFHTVQLGGAILGLVGLNRKAASSTRQTGDVFNRLDSTLTKLDVNIDKLARSFEALREDITSSKTELKEYGNAAKVAQMDAYSLVEELQGASTAFFVQKERTKLAREELLEFEYQTKQSALAVEKLKNEQELLRLEMRQADDTVDKLGDQLRDLRGDFKNVDDATQQTRRGFLKMDFSAAAMAEAVGTTIANMAEDVVYQIKDFVQSSVQEFYDFDRKTREIFTLLPGASAEFRESLELDALELGNELGRLPDEVLPAIYNGLSAGIPADNIIDNVRISSDAARAGVADLDTTLRLGISILNAQVTGVDNLEDVYDQLFFTVKNGVITLPQMTDEMAKVTSIAGEAGVSMQDISAAMIVMTRQGDSAQEATQLLSIMLTQLASEGSALASVFREAAGESFREFVAKGGTLAEAMRVLQTHAQNTGVALGDILGGKSPFFRDVQAARGALELTGKHLEELEHFSKEAENAMGSMAVAAEEMGESQELAALKAQAAVAEMKIAFGEALAPAVAVAAEKLTNVAKAITLVTRDVPKMGQAVRDASEELLEDAKRNDEYAEALEKVNQAYEDAGGLVGGLTGVQDDLIGSYYDISVAALAASGETDTLAHATKALRNEFGEEISFYNDGQFAIIADNFHANMYQMIEDANRLRESWIALETTQSDDILIRNSKSWWLAQTGAESYTETIDYMFRMERDNSMTHAEIVQARLEFADVYELSAEIIAESQARIAENAQIEKERIDGLREAYGSYVLDARNAQETETNWTHSLFETATALGINQYQVESLARATGEYDDAQIRNMLTQASMKLAVDELSAAIKAGDITTQEAVEILGDFQEQLAEDYHATLDYEDIVAAGEAAETTKNNLIALEGEYTTTYYNDTYNRTYNETYTKTTSYGDATASYKGGKFSAGELLIVGDGPNGEILPTTELVAFDKPGTVVPGYITNQILGQPASLSNNTPAGNINTPIQIIIQGNADENTVDKLINELKTVTKDMMNQSAQYAKAYRRMN